MKYPDVMVDLETTGTSPDETAIIQISAVRFNLLTAEVDPNVFDMCLTMPPGRYWTKALGPGGRRCPKSSRTSGSDSAHPNW